MRASLLLRVWLQKPCRNPKHLFISKALCLARKPLNRIIKNSWRVWEILAIFAGDLILAVKLKIHRLQQTRLVPPLQGGRFLMNGTAALQACWQCAGGLCTDLALSTLCIPRRIITMVLVRTRAQDTAGYLKSRSIFNHLLTKMEFLLDWALWLTSLGCLLMFTAFFACFLIVKCRIVTISYGQGRKLQYLHAWQHIEKSVANDFYLHVAIRAAPGLCSQVRRRAWCKASVACGGCWV